MKTLITKPQADFSGVMSENTTATHMPYLRKNLPRDKTMKTRTNKSFLTLLLQLLIINCSLLIATADATIRYVSPHGSNQSPYLTPETAANKIQDCINVSEPGDTIFVANGVYIEKITMIDSLTLIGAGMDSCLIDTRSIAPPTSFVAVTMKNHCSIEGFHILVHNTSAMGTIGIQSSSSGSGSIHYYGKVLYNKIAKSGTGIRRNDSFLIIHNNFIEDNYRGIDIDGIWNYVLATIYDNYLFKIKDFGILTTLAGRALIYNNFIVLETNLGTGISTSSNTANKIYNNFITTTMSGVGTTTTLLPTEVINNVIFGMQTGIRFNEPNIIKNNLVMNGERGIYRYSGNAVPKYNNSWNNSHSNYNNFTPDSTNLSVDPMVVNEDSLDFRLQMYSPLIDAGDPDILDVDSSRSDIGLYGGPYGMSYQYIDLPPRPPRNVIAVLDSVDITIKWNPNTEADFSHYNLYRDTTAGFPADSTTIVMSLSDTFYNHIIPPGINNYYYKLTAVDNQRNESLPSEEIAVNISSMTINDYPLTINDYILYQNYPNPFNPSTKIAYRLKEGGYVKLYVYDIKGELVDILVNQHQEGGYYEVEFIPGVRSQQTEDRIGLASGIYIYQIMVRNNNNIPVFTNTKKMIYLK